MSVPTTLETPPDPTSHNVARPLFGRTVSSLGNGLNFIAGFKGLRYVQQVVDFTGVDLAGAGLQTNDPRLRWVLSPLGKYIWWGAYVIATTSTGAPSIKVYLEDAGGVVIDGPIVFTAANGRLIEQDLYAHPSHPNYGANQGRDQIITTGWSISDAPGGAPRLLNAGFKQGTDVVLRVEVTDARIYSHFAVEAYRAEI